MRVAVVGNMNNGMFALTRHLRDRAVDAQLFFAPGFEHFHPKADTLDLSDLAFCHEVDWLQGGFYQADPEAIRNDLRGYDVLLATGAEAAAACLAGLPIHIYFPYGDDVLTYAHLPERFSLRAIASEQRRLMLGQSAMTLERMRLGTEFGYVHRAVCTAQHVIVDWTNPDWDRPLLSLPLKGTVHRSGWPFIYPQSYREHGSGNRRTDVHWRSAVDALRTRHDLIVLYHGRQEWTRGGDINVKNTDQLIRGFAEFVSSNESLTPCLAMIEYGRDVAASKALIAELGLTENVAWFPLMYRKDVMYLASNSDVCCGEFGRSYLTFGTLLEAMSIGKPVLHHRDDSLYPVPLYPLLNAREPAEIAAALVMFVEDPEGWRDKGREGRAWVDEHVIDRPLELICGLLEV